MSIYLPTIKQLQYLVALHEHGHFGKAAEACYVTQSSLSAGIRELETLIGVTLVERTRRVVRFSALGERIVEKARRVLREADELGAMVHAAGKPLTGEFSQSSAPIGPISNFICAKKQVAQHANRSVAAMLIACCWPCPMPAVISNQSHYLMIGFTSHFLKTKPPWATRPQTILMPHASSCSKMATACGIMRFPLVTGQS
jgi:DNA-binding MarR family transcriptional regulator